MVKYNWKNLTLQTVLEISSALKKEGETVILTREDDSYPSLPDRVKLSNDNQADVFISVHYNWSTFQSADGIKI